MELKTALYDTHIKHGGKLVPFAGYMLPIQYEGIIKEHMAVRNSAGLFDVSHMGEFLVTGNASLENIQKLVTNDCSGMENGQVKYSPMCNVQGGVIDDLLIYKKSDTEYMLVVNASNHDKDLEWIKSQVEGDVDVSDTSQDTALLALQGPNALKIVEKLTNDIPLKNYTFMDNISIKGIQVLLSRTGYTGEDGFEFYIDNNDAVSLWELLMEIGREFDITPCGLGARDTLRLEAAMPLYGHEMNEEITPVEAGLSYFVKLDKDFVGKEALVEKGKPAKKRTGIILTGRGIAREGSKIYCDDKEIGYVTSGTMSPYLNKAIAMALVETKQAVIGENITVEVRGKFIPGEIVKLPFYKKSL